MSTIEINVTEKIRAFIESSEFTSVVKKRTEEYTKSSEFESLIKSVSIKVQNDASFLETFARSMLLTSQIKTETERIVESKVVACANEKLKQIMDQNIETMVRKISEEVRSMLPEIIKTTPALNAQIDKVVIDHLNSYRANNLPGLVSEQLDAQFAGYISNYPGISDMFNNHTNALNYSLTENGKQALSNLVADPQYTVLIGEIRTSHEKKLEEIESKARTGLQRTTNSYKTKYAESERQAANVTNDLTKKVNTMETTILNKALFVSEKHNKELTTALEEQKTQLDYLKWAVVALGVGLIFTYYTLCQPLIIVDEFPKIVIK